MDCARRFFGAPEGTYSILTAILSVVVVGFTALAVDIGSALYWRHRLQTATDAAALAATFDLSRSDDIASASLAANGPAAAVIETAETGLYIDDPSIDGAGRFTPGPPENAVHLATKFDVPLYFMGALTGSRALTVNAESTAYNLPLAGIAVGTALVDSDIALINDLLEAVGGSSFDLTSSEADALEATRISVFRLFDGLAASSGSQSASMETVMASSVDLDTLAAAAASALTAQAQSPTATQTLAINALTRIAQEAGSTPAARVSDFVSIGAHQKRAARDMVSTAGDTLGVPAMSILTGYMHRAQQDTLLDLNETVTLPGLATVAIETVLSRSAIGGGPQGIAVIGPEGETAYSSKGRVRLTISLLQPISINLGLVNVSLPMSIPLVVDIAYGRATISDIACGSDVPSTADVAVTGQSGAVRLFIGSVTDNELVDLLTPLVPDPATIIDTPLVRVSGSTQVDIAQSGEETLHFDWNDIQTGSVRSIDGLPPLADSLVQLADNLVITVNNAPIGTQGLVSGLVGAQVSTILSALAPELDTVIASVGLKAGSIDVRATGLRCGIPALVT